MSTRNPVARHAWKFHKPKAINSKKLYSRKGKSKWNSQVT